MLPLLVFCLKTDKIVAIIFAVVGHLLDAFFALPRSANEYYVVAGVLSNNLLVYSFIFMAPRRFGLRNFWYTSTCNKQKLKINNDNNMATPRSLCSLVMTTVAHFCHLFAVERQQKRATFLIGENSVLVVVGCCAATFQADFVY